VNEFVVPNTLKTGDLQQFGENISIFPCQTMIFCYSMNCHELCHCFGGDASKTFSHALTDVIALTVQKQGVLATFQEQWRQCFDKAPH